jgi:hypothetical protein
MTCGSHHPHLRGVFCRRIMGHPTDEPHRVELAPGDQLGATSEVLTLDRDARLYRQKSATGGVVTGHPNYRATHVITWPAQPDPHPEQSRP